MGQKKRSTTFRCYSLVNVEKVTVADFAFQKKIDLQIWHLGRAFEYNFVPGGAGI